MLFVSTETITSWELNHHEPQVHFYPRIIEYFGYCSLFDLTGISQLKRLKQYIFTNELTQKEYAKILGINPQALKRRIST